MKKLGLKKEGKEESEDKVEKEEKGDEETVEE
jgi:hypothetical protein